MNNSILLKEYKSNAGEFLCAERHRKLFLEKKPRHLFQEVMHPTGRPLRMVELVLGDEDAMQALHEIVSAEHKGSLKDRTVEDHRRMLSYGQRFNGKGGMALGIMDSMDRVVGMAVVEVMDDESDPGSGPVLYYQGKKHNKIICFKSLCILKEFRKLGDVDLEAMLYEGRLGICLGVDSWEFAMMKTNYDVLVERNVARLWQDMTDNPDGIDGLDLVQESEGGKQIRVLMLPREKAQEWYAENSTDMNIPEVYNVKYHAADAISIAPSKPFVAAPTVH